MKGDETMKQIMKRGLKLFLVLCLLVESFSTVAAVKAEETADKGRMVKIYVDDTLIESKWYNYGEKIQLPKFYEWRQLDDTKVVEFIREWCWYYKGGDRRSLVDETPDITLTSDLRVETDGSVRIDGDILNYLNEDQAKKVLVKIYVGASVYKQMLYDPGEKIRFPECCLDDCYTISEWRYSLKENAWKDESDIVSYVTPDITVPQGIKVLNIYGESNMPPIHYVFCETKEMTKPTNVIQTSGQQSEVKDTTPPVIKNIKNKKKYKKSKVTVYVKDNDELYKVTVNGKKVKLKKTKKGKYKGYYQFTLKRKKKTKKYKITAMDITDNRTTKTIWICKNKK